MYVNSRTRFFFHPAFRCGQSVFFRSIRICLALLVCLAAGARPLHAAPGDTIKQFENTWSYSTIGLAYDPDRRIMRYAHESQSSTGTPTIYDVEVASPYGLISSFALSGVNPGWHWQVDNRDGAAYDTDTQTYFLPDYNGDLSYYDDNIVEIDDLGSLVAYWQTDTETGGPACSCSLDDCRLNRIIDIAPDPDNARRYYATAAYDGNTIYYLDLSDTSGGSAGLSPCVLVSRFDPPDLNGLMGDVLGIEYDAVSGGYWLTDWDSNTVALLDRDFNLVRTLTVNAAGGYSSGVAPMNDVGAGEPYQLWLTDFSSDKTTIVESGAYKSPQADLAVTKDDGVTQYIPLTTLTYRVVVSNSGPNAAENVTVTDSAPSGAAITGWTCTAGGGAVCPEDNGTGTISQTALLLPVGGTLIYKIDLYASTTSATLTNTATVGSDTTDPDEGNNSASDTDGLWSSGTGITKTDGDVTYTPGTTVTYRVVAANYSVSALSGFTITDPAPADTTMTWTCTAFGAGSACPGDNGTGGIDGTASLAPSGALYFEIQVQVPSSFTGPLVNTASVSNDNDTFSPDTATDNNTQYSIADLSVATTDGTGTYTPGTNTVYDVTVANAGPSDADNVRIQGAAPAGTSITAWTCTAAGGAACPAASGSGDLDQTAATLPAGGSLLYEVELAIDADFGAGGGLEATLATTASVSGDDHDPDETNNSATDVNARIAYTVTGSAGSGGAIAPASRTVEHGLAASFTVTPDEGYLIDSVSGCGGSLVGDIYTTGDITGDCTVTAAFAATPTTTTTAPTTTTTASATTTAPGTTTVAPATTTAPGTTTIAPATTTAPGTTTTTAPTTTTTASATTTAPGTTTVAPATTTTTTTMSGSSTTTSAAGGETTTTTPAASTTTTTTGMPGPCPATKVLGPDNPTLESLRAFRDTKLARSALGRDVIRVYYNNAAAINSALERSPALRAAAKRVLEAVAAMAGGKQ